MSKDDDDKEATTPASLRSERVELLEARIASLKDEVEKLRRAENRATRTSDQVTALVWALFLVIIGLVVMMKCG